MVETGTVRYKPEPRLRFGDYRHLRTARTDRNLSPPDYHYYRIRKASYVWLSNFTDTHNDIY